jgi:hypothetical protein
MNHKLSEMNILGLLKFYMLNMPARLDDVIKTCENLHVQAQHQLKILLPKYEHLFDGTLGEFNMEYVNN